MEGELESLRLEPAENGFTINVNRMRKEGKHSDSPSPRNRPKIASDAESALAVIAKEIGAKGRRRGAKGLRVMGEAEPSSRVSVGRKGRRKTARKRA